MRIVKINQLGDTIIEVLIAIAVLSVVLSGAYAIANKSLSNIRQSQEHGEALKLAESQAERLKQLAGGGGNDNNGGNIFTSGNYCLNINGSGLKIDPLASCTVSTPRGGIISVNPTAVVALGPSYNFKIVVTWDGIHGGRDNVTLNYRLDK